MSMLERHETPVSNTTQKVQSQPPVIKCINSYLVNHGLRLGKIIGEGSYSKVRLCMVTLKDKVEKFIACKIISKKKASDDFVTKFLPRELEILDHLMSNPNPNIISVFDVVQFDQHVYIFMDFCNKGDLLEFIKKKGYLSEKRSQNYFFQILSAVRYLHGMDLAHRDLKCENVLLCSNDIVKISDFGFSRYCHNSHGKRILSETFCGSAAYAAPEILLGTEYNPKLYDMWSLGCILFIMLTGHMPYDEGNLQVMLQNQKDRLLTYPHQVEGLISKHAKRFIRHLLEPDVTRRATVEHALSNSWFGSLKMKHGGNDPGGGDCLVKDSFKKSSQNFGICNGPINEIASSSSHKPPEQSKKLSWREMLSDESYQRKGPENPSTSRSAFPVDDLQTRIRDMRYSQRNRKPNNNQKFV